MNFQQYVAKNKLTSQEKTRVILLGKKVRIIGNTCTHNFGPIGTSWVIDPSWKNSISFNGNAGQLTGIRPGIGSTWLNYIDFEVVENTLEAVKQQIDSNNDQVKALKEETAVLKKKMDYMEYHKLDEFDDRQFIAYEIVQVMNEQMDDKNKAMRIAELLP